MTCSKCGQSVQEGDKYCGQCGVRIEGEIAEPLRVFTPIDTNDQTEMLCQTYAEVSPKTDDAYALNLPMRWYKFIIYLWLPLSMINYLIAAGKLLTGYEYTLASVNRSAAYAYYPGLQSAEMMFAVFALGIAVLAFIAQRKLSGFKMNAHSLFLYMLMAGMIFTVASNFVMGAITGYYGGQTSQAGTIVGQLIFLLPNWVYFNKRKELFRNS